MTAPRPQSEDGAKRAKMSDGSAAPLGPLGRPGSIRRSTRHRKLRGEKALIVSANQTLKELKIQVLKTGSTPLYVLSTSRVPRCFPKPAI